ncbi:MAG: hypothetical protein NT005_00985 [Spirochaetes bacterium]|nr:hypothetical protein [Spirochaetota bacterium]
MKVVIDTNVFVSSLLNPEGSPRKVIDLWRFEKITREGRAAHPLSRRNSSPFLGLIV